jgi:HK97 gp10 family phage protein
MRLWGEISGDREVWKIIKHATPKIVKKGMKASANAGGTIALKAARAKAPILTGTTLLSLKKVTKAYKSGIAVCIIGAATDVVSIDAKGKRHVPANYLFLVEEGHEGPHPAPAHPFIEPSFEAVKDKVRVKMLEKLASVVKRELAK